MEGKRIELNVEGTVVRTYVQSTYVHNTKSQWPCIIYTKEASYVY